MIKKTTILILSFFVHLSIQACINEATHVLRDGTKIGEEAENYVPYGTDFDPMNEEYERDLDTLLKLWKNTNNPVYYSDYGVALIYLGRYEEAKKVFISIEKTSPNQYYTAANLGTTYELLGKNDSALIWIKKAVAIDPNSHEASEWLHVKILEAKIGGEEYITNEFLIGTDFGDGEDPVSKLDKVKLIALRNSIYYQLNERVSFIKPKDKIVGLLLFELGNLCVLTADVTNAMYNYEKAKEYGYENPVMKTRYDKYLGMQDGLDNKYGKKKEEEEKEESQFNLMLVIVSASVIGLILFILLFIYLKRRKKARISKNGL